MKTLATYILSKIKYLKYALLPLCIFFSVSAHSQSWVPVGEPGCTPDSAWGVSIAVDVSGTPFIVYSDPDDSFKATVLKYNGSSWVAVGNRGFSVAANNTSIAIDGSGTPYVVFQEVSGATVMKYDGSNWVVVGNAGFSAGNVDLTCIAIDGTGTPYVAYEDLFDSRKATVMKYNGTAWVTVGSQGFSAGQAEGYKWLAIDGSGTPYVVYEDWVTPVGNATVMKYNGTSWVNVGTSGFTPSEAEFTSIAIDRNGTPYVIYTDGAYANKASVMKFDGTNWVQVGAPGFSVGESVWTSIGIDSIGIPYVVYEDGYLTAEITSATAMMFNDSGWVSAGNPDFSAGGVGYTSIAMDRGGAAYVVYNDSVYGNKATVMKLAAPSGVKNINNPASLSFSVLPNPSQGTFSVTLLSATNEDAQITIANMLGEQEKVFTIPSNKETQLHIDVPPGIYLLSATTTSGSVYTKIVIE